MMLGGYYLEKVQSDKRVLVTRTSITPVLKSKKEDLGNYKMSAHLCSWEVCGANVPGSHFQAYEERHIGNNQFGFNKSQLTNQLARPVDKGTPMDVVHLTKSLAFEMVCHHIPELNQ